MANNDCPRLCGGTFFLLLLQAIKQRSKARDRLEGGSDGLKDTDVLIGLIRVAQPDYIAPAPPTFKQNTSSYKACEISNGTYLPFADGAFISAFDSSIKINYPTALTAMSGFVNSLIDTGSTGKHIKLIRALLELVETDQSIANADMFYVSQDGIPMKKSALCAMTDIYLPAFLLGLWHFIVQNRNDNTIGRVTFEAWHEKPNIKGQKWVYVGRIGEGVSRAINITVLMIVDSEDEIAAAGVDEPFVEYDEPHVEQPPPEPSESTTNQVINTSAVFINHGTNCTQINNTGTLNIDRGGAKT